MELKEDMILITDIELVEKSDGYQILMTEQPDSKDFFTMLIGPAEFAAIAKEKGLYKPPRPLTHDLYLSILKRLGLNFVRVEIYEMRENSYIANVVYRENGNEVEIDSRPSDALALALNQKVPVLVHKKLFRAKLSKEEMDFYKDVIKVVKFKGGE
ncbi:MAG: bifunctional nuclease family protein [Pseudomonadota bacterium]